jgi:hypothetical protein
VLLFIDTITFLVGLTLLVLAAYAAYNYGSFVSLVNYNTIYITVAVGVVLIFVACLGCFASQKGHRMLLFCYLIIVLACLCAQIASAILVAQYLGKVSSIDVRVARGAAPRGRADRTRRRARKPSPTRLPFK